jgi:hypothetical protein
MRWVGHVAFIEATNAYKILVGKPEGKRPTSRPRRKGEDNTGLDPREIRLEFVNWTHLAQDRNQWRAVVNTVMYLWVP